MSSGVYLDLEILIGCDRIGMIEGDALRWLLWGSLRIPA
jgi:hypothetical protein